MANPATQKAYIDIAVSLVVWTLLYAAGFLVTLYAAFVLGQIWDLFIVPEGYDPLGLKFRIGILSIVGVLLASTVSSIIGFASDDTEGSSVKVKAATALGGLVGGLTMGLLSAHIWAALL